MDTVGEVNINHMVVFTASLGATWNGETIDNSLGILPFAHVKTVLDIPLEQCDSLMYIM